MTISARSTAVLLACALVASCGGAGTDRTVSPGPSSSGGQAAPSASGATPSAEARVPAPVDGRMLPTPYQPLWPFTGLAQVREWQRSYRSGGHAPWHLSADQTALSFAQGYLGFQEIDRVTVRAIKGTDARIGVGYLSEEGGRVATAAMVHLIRAGSGADAPWEVVGTDDTTFSLTVPAYGARATSPMTVGGRITGADENIQVRMFQPSAQGPVGRFCCRPSGGLNARWSVTLRYGPTSGQVATIVAWTGGHLAAAERFAVTAVAP